MLVAFIPARAGSKRLPGKNLLNFNGHPLIAETILQAKESGIFDKIIVSTDSEEIAEVSRKFGAEVPFLREGMLAGDEAKTIDVVIDFLEKTNLEIKTIALLQVTSPLRRARHIIEAYSLYTHSRARSCISFVDVTSKFNTLFLGGENGIVSIGEAVDCQKLRNTSLLKANGAIYIIDKKSLLEFKKIYFEDTAVFLMDEESSVDIDYYFEFQLALEIMKYKNDNQTTRNK